MSKKRHPNKEIEAALQYAEQNGWIIEAVSGHAWGVIKCPANNPACWNGIYCVQSIWSTPKNPTSHARLIRKIVDKCFYKDVKTKE